MIFIKNYKFVNKKGKSVISETKKYFRWFAVFFFFAFMPLTKWWKLHAINYTHTAQDTGEGGPLSYKSIGNQSQLLVTAQKHTYMLAAGQSKKTGETHTEGGNNPYSPMHG